MSAIPIIPAGNRSARPITAAAAREIAEDETRDPESIIGKRNAAMVMVAADLQLQRNQAHLIPFEPDTVSLGGETREYLADWQECVRSQVEDEPAGLVLNVHRGTVRNTLLSPATVQGTLSRLVRDLAIGGRHADLARVIPHDRGDDDRVDHVSAQHGHGLCACLGQVSGFCNGKVSHGGTLENCRWQIWNARTTHLARLHANAAARRAWLREHEKYRPIIGERRWGYAIKEAVKKIDADYPV